VEAVRLLLERFTKWLRSLTEDDANLLVHYKRGARGIMHCSKISAGEENHLSIRAYGTHASLEWNQEHPNELTETD